MLIFKKDYKLAEMSFEQWDQAVKPKVNGSWNLHTALPKGMDFFILLSSISGVLGNPAQSNYSAGNTFQDALAQYRVSQGEKTVALDLGPVLFGGYVAQNPRIKEHIKSLKAKRFVSLEEFYGLLDYYCNPRLHITDPVNAQVVAGLELPTRILASGSPVPSILWQPLFRNLHQIGSSMNPMQHMTGPHSGFRSSISKKKSLEEAAAIVSVALKKKFSQIIGLPVININIDATVDSYGVDSLVTVELRNWLAKEFAADVAVFDIRGATISQIGLTTASRSSFRNDE